MLIVTDQSPIDSVYYLSACCFTELGLNKDLSIISLYEIVKEKYNVDLQYNRFILAINFLFLFNKIDYIDGKVGIKRVK
ncbi:MAG: hypothetical protein RR557_08045 [Bacilli bacterium]